MKIVLLKQKNVLQPMNYHITAFVTGRDSEQIDFHHFVVVKLLVTIQKAYQPLLGHTL